MNIRQSKSKGKNITLDKQCHFMKSKVIACCATNYNLLHFSHNCFKNLYNYFNKKFQTFMKVKRIVK
jgi:hypothetical protein